MLKRVAVASAILVLIGCSSPTKSTDLFGSWSPDPSSAELFRRHSDTRNLSLQMTRLELRDDGSFTARNLPMFIISGSPENFDRTFDGSGTWHLPDGAAEIALVFLSGVEIPPLKAPLRLHHTKNDFYLYHDLDPDIGPRLEFRRRH